MFYTCVNKTINNKVAMKHIVFGKIIFSTTYKQQIMIFVNIL